MPGPVLLSCNDVVQRQWLHREFDFPHLDMTTLTFGYGLHEQGSVGSFMQPFMA